MIETAKFTLKCHKNILHSHEVVFRHFLEFELSTMEITSSHLDIGVHLKQNVWSETELFLSLFQILKCLGVCFYKKYGMSTHFMRSTDSS